MDRRQRKTREAIFQAFSQLLARKDFNQITVGEIIQAADVGRATFYAHFETKDFLLKAFCEELFCHIFDGTDPECDHRHIFHCQGESSPFLHLFRHLQKNDHNILALLSSQNNELFLRYFKENLKELINNHPHLLGGKKPRELPDDYWSNHISATFVEMIRWWLHNGMKENPQTLTNYFYAAIYGEDKSNN